MKKERRDLLLGTKREVNYMTMCETKTEECVQRKCDRCGTKLIDRHLNDKSQFEDKEVFWNSWERVEEKYISSEGKEKSAFKWKQRSKVTSFKELIRWYKDSLENFPTHITNADWQHEQFVSLQKNLP